MMGRKHREQANFFYEFRLDDMIPKGHLLRKLMRAKYIVHLAVLTGCRSSVTSCVKRHGMAGLKISSCQNMGMGLP